MHTAASSVVARRAGVAGFVLFVALVAGLAARPAAAQDTAATEHTVWFFWGDGCPHCAALKPHIDVWSREYPELRFRSLEVWHSETNRATFAREAARRGVDADAVPTTFIGDEAWVGFTDAMLAEMQEALDALRKGAAPVGDESTTLPWLGEVDVGAESLLGLTAMIGFVDGFNPCSLWVLSVLLAMIVRSGSRRDVVLVGTTYLSVTALAYGLFVAGVFSVMSYVAHLGWVRVVVAVLAIGYALVNLKDYLWFKRGWSFTIPERVKPAIYRQARSVMTPRRSTLGTVAATASMAVGISAVELACTAGFPVVWSTAVAHREIATAQFVGLLTLCMTIYLVDELLLFGAVVVTMRVTRVQERHGRTLKLVGGTLMLSLALTLLVAPSAMTSVTGHLAGHSTAGAATLKPARRARRVLVAHSARHHDPGRSRPASALGVRATSSSHDARQSVCVVAELMRARAMSQPMPTGRSGMRWWRATEQREACREVGHHDGPDTDDPGDDPPRPRANAAPTPPGRPARRAVGRRR